jgi:hypothetical protein
MSGQNGFFRACKFPVNIRLYVTYDCHCAGIQFAMYIVEVGICGHCTP